MIKYFFGAVVLVVTGSVLTGCGSTLNIGESEFSCPGTVANGFKCMGVRDLYKATDGPMASYGKKPVDAVGNVIATAELDKKSGSEKGVSYEPTPWMDKPTPIRSQARVMRLWVAPFEDEVGDLNAPGMVFTEIEPRRWNVGEGLVKRPAKLSLVQVSSPVAQGTSPDSAASSSPFGVTNANGQSVGSLKTANPNGNKSSKN
jgi:conjugal transfer pilus assembly protein TraV